MDRLTRRADALAEHPLIGQVVEQYQREDIREVYEGRYRMIYRVLPDHQAVPERMPEEFQEEGSIMVYLLAGSLP